MINVECFFVSDIFMFRHSDDLQLSFEDKPKNLSSIVNKWWKSMNRNLAFHLFHLAQSGNKAERRRAIDSLSSLKHLKGNLYYKSKFVSLFKTIII